MEEVSNWIMFVKYLNTNPGLIAFFELIAAVVTAITFIAILFVTIWYARSTHRLAIKTSESIEITKEKERIDRTLELFDKFDNDKFFSLQNMLNLPSEFRIIIPTKQMLKNLENVIDNPSIIEKISYFIDYFDTVAVFYFEGKLDKKLFETKLRDNFISFVFNYREIIKRIFEGDKKDIVNILYWRRNFLKLAVQLLDKKRNIKSKYKENFEEYYDFYNKLLGED